MRQISDSQHVGQVPRAGDVDPPEQPGGAGQLHGRDEAGGY